MAITKYKKQYKEMIEKNAKLFDDLKTFSKNPNSAEFKETQLKALRVIRKNEDILCSKTENTSYSSFSTGLADKFWEEVRRDYPEVDIAED